MSSPRKEPVFDTVERHSGKDGTLMLIKYFRDGGYIQADPNSDGYGISMFWATDLDALETLAATGKLCGLPNGEDGMICDEGYEMAEDEPARLIRSMWRNRTRTITSYMLEGTAFDLYWSESAKRWPWTDMEHAQIGLSIRGLHRVDIEAMIITTGIRRVAVAAPRTLDEFNIDTLLLQQA